MRPNPVSLRTPAKPVNARTPPDALVAGTCPLVDGTIGLGRRLGVLVGVVIVGAVDVDVVVVVELGEVIVVVEIGLLVVVVGGGGEVVVVIVALGRVVVVVEIGRVVVGVRPGHAVVGVEGRRQPDAAGVRATPTDSVTTPTMASARLIRPTENFAKRLRAVIRDPCCLVRSIGPAVLLR